MYNAHAASTTTGGGLNDDRIADLLSQFQGAFVVIVERAIRARHGGYAGLNHDLDCGYLVAHQPDRLRRRADKDEAAVFDLFGEVGILGKKAIAWMYRVGISHFHG